MRPATCPPNFGNLSAKDGQLVFFSRTTRIRTPDNKETDSISVAGKAVFTRSYINF
jgi:hypothetical protein